MSIRPAAQAGPPGSLLVLLNKPYGVVCQFSAHPKHPSLADLVRIPGVYPAGRLDWNSEGLVLLTADGRLQHQIAHPRSALGKTYWAQVEGVPEQAALDRLTKGVNLGDFLSQPARVRRIDEPAGLWPRDPPIRVRQAIPTTWIEITLAEGKNHQVRRMTAAVGHPTLRLVRSRIGPWGVLGLPPGEHKSLYVTID